MCQLMVGPVLEKRQIISKLNVAYLKFVFYRN